VAHPYSTFVAAEKAVSFFPGWSKPEPETDYMWFDAALEIGGVTEAGFVLHGGCYQHQPNRHVTMELRVRRLAGRRSVPLCRLCWRSLLGGHTNQRGRGPPGVAGRRTSDTHYHSFDLNWLAADNRMRGGNLPLAMEVGIGLESFEQMREFVGNAFRISNISVVSPPDWQYTLV
jgi:hypothetical protein